MTRWWIRHVLYAMLLGVFFDIAWSRREVHAAAYSNRDRLSRLGARWSHRERRTIATGRSGHPIRSRSGEEPDPPEQAFDGARDPSLIANALENMKDDDSLQELVLPPELTPADADKPFASMVVTTVVGERVALPCSVEPAERAGEDAAVLVLWYKDDIPQPVFTVDARATGSSGGGLPQQQQQPNSHVGGPQSLRSAPQTSSLDQLNGRATFEIDHKPAFLQLQPVAESDAGEYRCRVDFKRARSMNTVINLRVIVPPGQPVVSADEDGEPVLPEGLAGPFNEGEPLTLFCTAAMGKPRATLLWMHTNGRVVDDTFSYDLANNVVRNALEIPALRRDHLLTTYTCQAANNNITAPSLKTVTLDVNVRPLDVRIAPTTRALSAGSPVEFACSSSGARPPAHISWWLGDRELSAQTNDDFIANDDSGTLGASSTTSVLTYTPKAEDHGASLVCRAQNINMPDRAIQHTQTLDIHYAPQITLTLGANLRPGEIFENRDVYLDCDIRANPPTSEVVWHFEGRELHTDKHNGIIVSSSSLVLQKVSRSQRGWFTCSTSNREGSAVSNRLFLRVKYAPRCRSGQRRIFGVDLYESAQIACELDADPPEEVDFTWSFNNTDHVGNIKNYSGSSSSSVHNHHHHSQRKQFSAQFSTHALDMQHSSRDIINYRPLTEQDYGELLCFGRNDVGMQEIPCVYHITPAAPPQAPENCTQVNATDNGFTVECVEGLDGAWNGGHRPQQLAYVAELYDEDHSIDATSLSSSGSAGTAAATAAKSSPPPLCLANVSVAGGGSGSAPVLFVFADVPHADDNDAGYRVHIYAVNRKGRSAVSRVVAHVLNASKYTQASGGAVRLAVLRPIVGLLLGLIVAATLIGIFAFTAAACHKRCQDAGRNGGVSQKDINKWGVTLLKPDSSGTNAGPDADTDDLDCTCGCGSPVCHSLPPLTPLGNNEHPRGPSLLDLEQPHPDAHRYRHQHHANCGHPDVIQQQQQPHQQRPPTREPPVRSSSYRGGRFIDDQPDVSHSSPGYHEHSSSIIDGPASDCTRISQTHISGNSDGGGGGDVTILRCADASGQVLDLAQVGLGDSGEVTLTCDTAGGDGKTTCASITGGISAVFIADDCSRSSIALHRVRIPRGINDLLSNGSSSGFHDGSPHRHSPLTASAVASVDVVTPTSRSDNGETLSFVGTAAPTACFGIRPKPNNELTSFIGSDNDTKSTSSRESCV